MFRKLKNQRGYLKKPLSLRFDTNSHDPKITTNNENVFITEGFSPLSHTHSYRRGEVCLALCTACRAQKFSHPLSHKVAFIEVKCRGTACCALGEAPPRPYNDKLPMFLKTHYFTEHILVSESNNLVRALHFPNISNSTRISMK